MVSIGVIEVKGLAAAFSALDTMLKTADVSYLTSEKSLGNGLIAVIIEGSAASVEEALAAGKDSVSGISDIVTAASILRPHPEILTLLGKLPKKNKIQMERDRSHNNAVGLIEIYGYTAALLVADAALKAADVNLIGLDKTKTNQPNTPGFIMFLKLEGSVSAVHAALEAGNRASINNDIASSFIIARPNNHIYNL